MRSDHRRHVPAQRAIRVSHSVLMDRGAWRKTLALLLLLDDVMGLHDRLFKQLLRTFFADFLRLVAPDLAAQLRPQAARFLDKELFIDWPEGRRRELDLRGAVPRTISPGRNPWPRRWRP